MITAAFKRTEWVGGVVPLAAVLAMMLGAVTACVTTTESSPPPKESPTDAASFNVQLGANYLSQGRLELAKEKLDKAVVQDDQLAIAHTYSGLLYDRLNDSDKAAYHYRRALRLAPDDSATLNLYGAFLCRQGDVSTATRYFMKALDDPLYRTPEVPLTNAGICLLQENEDVDAAESYFRRALQANQRYPDALWQLARVSETRGLPLQARAFFQRFAEVGQMSSEALWLGVRIERSLGDDEGASRYAEKLLEDYPDSVEASELMRSGWRGSS
jgi:type IV pilus assembly protein PilF